MSGILGLWNLDGQPLPPELLTRLSAPLAHRGGDGEGAWLQGPVGLACQLRRVTPESAAETQPLIHPAGTVAVFDGRLDNRAELLGRLKEDPLAVHGAPDTALVLAAYEAWGDRFPEYLNGDFALAIFDPRRQQLLLARDAIGVRPLYYCRVGDVFLFASEIKAILAHPRMAAATPDDPSLAHYLFRGHLLKAGSTCFQGVASLPPGYRGSLIHRNFLISRYWDFDPARCLRFASFPEYVEVFKHLFQQAVRRRLRSTAPVATLVSGGLDSSSIFCQAEALRRQAPDTYPPLLGISEVFEDGSPADEASFLRDIESKYDLSITRIKSGASEFSQGLRELLWHIEVPNAKWGSTHALEKQAHNSGARVLLTGIWGDQFLFDSAYLLDLCRQFSIGSVCHDLKEFRLWNTDIEDSRVFLNLFVKDLAKYYLPEGVQRGIRQWTNRPGGNSAASGFYSDYLRQQVSWGTPNGGPDSRAFATAHAWALYHRCRSPLEVSRMECLNKVGCMHGLEVASPFLDRDLLAFLMAIPGEMVVRQGVPKALLRQAMRGILPETIAGRRWKADFTHLANEGMARDFSGCCEFLKTEARAVRRGYVRPELLAGELSGWQKRIKASNGLVSNSLQDLFGLELWLEVFCHAGDGRDAEASG